MLYILFNFFLQIMVCRAGQICFIQCNLSGVKNKIFTADRLLLHESTRGEDLYVHIEEHCQIQPDSFKLYLLSGRKLVSNYIPFCPIVNAIIHQQFTVLFT